MSQDDTYDGDLKAARASVRQGAEQALSGEMRITEACHYIYRMMKHAMCCEALKATYPDRKTMRPELPDSVRGMLEQETAKVAETIRGMLGVVSRTGGAPGHHAGRPPPHDIADRLDRLLLDASDLVFRKTCELVGDGVT